LQSECVKAFTRTGLANLETHTIFTPYKAGINFLYCTLAQLSHSLTIELQNFLTANHSTINGRLVAGNSDATEAEERLTLGIFDDRKHFDTLSGEKTYLQETTTNPTGLHTLNLSASTWADSRLAYTLPGSTPAQAQAGPL
jgi:hypothetical protein